MPSTPHTHPNDLPNLQQLLSRLEQTTLNLRLVLDRYRPADDRWRPAPWERSVVHDFIQSFEHLNGFLSADREGVTRELRHLRAAASTP